MFAPEDESRSLRSTLRLRRPARPTTDGGGPNAPTRGLSSCNSAMAKRLLLILPVARVRRDSILWELMFQLPNELQSFESCEFMSSQALEF